MRTPRVGDGYQVCLHLVKAAASEERHYWDARGKPWIVLCAGCHARYAKRSSVEMSGAVKRISTLIEVDPHSARSVHSHAATPVAASDAQASPAGTRMLDAQLADEVTSLHRRVDELRLDVLLPAHNYSPQAAAAKAKQLHMLHQDLQPRLDASQPMNSITRTELDMILESLVRVQATTGLAEMTSKRVQKLSREAQSLLKRTLSQPFSGFYYRRRVYRRLVRERDDLISLITSCCSDASPWIGPSEEGHREHAPYARSRKNSGEGQPLDSRPWFLPRKAHEWSWEIDVRKLEKAPAFRDALLVLRHILGGPSWLN